MSKGIAMGVLQAPRAHCTSHCNPPTNYQLKRGGGHDISYVIATSG